MFLIINHHIIFKTIYSVQRKKSCILSIFIKINETESIHLPIVHYDLFCVFSSLFFSFLMKNISFLSLLFCYSFAVFKSGILSFFSYFFSEFLQFFHQHLLLFIYQQCEVFFFRGSFFRRFLKKGCSFTFYCILFIFILFCWCFLLFLLFLFFFRILK